MTIQAPKSHWLIGFCLIPHSGQLRRKGNEKALLTHNTKHVSCAPLISYIVKRSLSSSFLPSLRLPENTTLRPRSSSTMSEQSWPTAVDLNALFGITFKNASSTKVSIWLEFDGEWWVSPELFPGDQLLPIPLALGVGLKWVGVSNRAVTRYNLIHHTEYTTQSEEIALLDEVGAWRGDYTCSQGMLGRSMKLSLF